MRFLCHVFLDLLPYLSSRANRNLSVTLKTPRHSIPGPAAFKILHLSLDRSLEGHKKTHMTLN